MISTKQNVLAPTKIEAMPILFSYSKSKYIHQDNSLEPVLRARDNLSILNEEDMDILYHSLEKDQAAFHTNCSNCSRYGCRMGHDAVEHPN